MNQRTLDTINSLSAEQTSLKHALATASARGNFEAVAKYGARLAEIEAQLGPMQTHFFETYLNALEKEFADAEAAERQGNLDFESALKERDQARAKFEQEIAIRLKPYDQKVNEALALKRRTREAANAARGRISEARRAATNHFVAHNPAQ